MDKLFENLGVADLFGNTSGNTYLRMGHGEDALMFGNIPELVKIPNAIRVTTVTLNEKSDFIAYLKRNRRRETVNFEMMKPGWGFIKEGAVYYRVDEKEQAVDLHTGQWGMFTNTASVTPISPKTIEGALAFLTTAH